MNEDHFDFEKLTTYDGSDYVHDWYFWGEGFEGEIIESYVPRKNALHSPYPNPFNPATFINFELRDAGLVSLIVYDVQGRIVANLIDGFQPAGIYQRTFDASDLSSGVYFACLKAEGFSQTQKLLLIK